ncbi:MAG: hypothetical protein ABIN67_09805 [Ferruginibacter sp.]
MPIKKSAILLMAITAASFTLLALSSSKKLPAAAPTECMKMKTCDQIIEAPAFSSWDIISHIVFRPTA